MATRFGGVSPVYSYALRMRWITGSLVAVLIILLLLLVIVARGQNHLRAEVVEEKVWSAPSPLFEVVTARVRVEEGMQIQEHMLGTLSLSAVPEGAVLSKDRQILPGLFAKTLIPAGIPITREQFSQDPPLSVLHIPAGMRAVTITVDPRTGVEGLVKANRRVDVLHTFTDRGNEKKVVTLVPFAKVLSVNGDVTGNSTIKSEATVTLCVSERDAKRIELARALGALSLVLVSEIESGPRRPDSPITPKDVGVRPDSKTKRVLGRMTTMDPKTGATTILVLTADRDWVTEEEFERTREIEEEPPLF